MEFAPQFTRAGGKYARSWLAIADKTRMVRGLQNLYLVSESGRIPFAPSQTKPASAGYKIFI